MILRQTLHATFDRYNLRPGRVSVSPDPSTSCLYPLRDGATVSTFSASSFSYAGSALRPNLVLVSGWPSGACRHLGLNHVFLAPADHAHVLGPHLGPCQGPDHAAGSPLTLRSRGGTLQRCHGVDARDGPSIGAPMVTQRALFTDHGLQVAFHTAGATRGHYGKLRWCVQSCERDWAWCIACARS